MKTTLVPGDICATLRENGVPNEHFGKFGNDVLVKVTGRTKKVIREYYGRFNAFFEMPGKYMLVLVPGCAKTCYRIPFGR